ncbi:FkbM family methyltransferase [Devosia sp.]|uniref:FkbM family methyltransferase n=1 Tax=Devosia sp. TaxID=1871048 RepID=UPI002FC7F57A
MKGPRQFARNIRSRVRVLRAVLAHPIHEGRRAEAAKRWLRLTFADWVAPGHQVIPYVEGAVLVWRREATSVMICARYGLGEFEDMAFVLHFLRSEDLFCDVGANAGVYTVLAAKVVGAKVVSAEPVPTTYDLLMQNVYANGISDRVDALRCGVGRERGRLHFTATNWSYNRVVDGPGEGVVEVDVLPLDMILDGRIPRAMKVDVEGFEAEVVAGAAATLGSPDFQALIIEMSYQVEAYGARLDAIDGVLKAHGLLGPFWYDPWSRSLVPPGDLATRKANHIYVRDLDFVAERLRGARKFNVHNRLI